MKIYFISMRFSPAHSIHMRAYAKCLSNNDIEYYLNPKYEMFSNELEEFGNVTYTNKKLLMSKDSIYIFFSPSEKNLKLIKQIKKYNSKIIYLYHEPWRGYINYFKELHGIKNGIKIFPIHYVQSQMLRYSDVIIIPSKTAESLFKKYENKNNQSKVRIIQLVFIDEYSNNEFIKREYFSFIGTMIYQHNYDLFLKFVEENIDNVCYKFLIATKSNVSEEWKEKMKKYIDNGKLVIADGKPLTNDEMNYYYSQSFLCWNIYRTCTQSGVLPNAFMNGTPVIASPVGGLLEFVEENKTGKFVNDYEEISETVNEIYDNQYQYRYETRKYYTSNFDYKSQEQKIKELVKI